MAKYFNLAHSVNNYILMNENFQTTLTSTDTADALAFKGVIFDMDGTLLESTEADYRAWEKVFNNYNQELSFEKYAPMLGVKSADVVRNEIGFHDELDVKRILKEKFDYFVEYVNENPIKPVFAAETFLKSLAQYPVKVALATSSRKEKMQMVLKQLDFMQYFEAIVTGDEVSNGKPAPDIFLLAAKRLGLSPEECMVIEDGPIGVAAAKSANMKCVAITETHQAEQLSAADLIIDTYEHADIREITEKLKAVF
ncbi:MAG: glycoprotease/HAD-superfamily hydrolase like protein [Segetibacter sp.]|jgi:beta-phosphoglucomutase family hydrolase|nr:glycoprotease/HAD-superfamily hydrolase like protein [Segetibacter sp.]